MKNGTLKNGLKLALVAGGVVVLVPTVYGQGIGLQTLDRMLVATPQTLERGEVVYQDQCATCHGDAGQGGAPLGERLGAQGFVGVDVERSGVKSIYSVIAYGIEDAEHPVFENLFVQDRWAVSHYVHSLIDDPQPDSPQIVQRVRDEAQFGVCDPEIRAEIDQFLTPEDDAQIQLGQQTFNQQCASCHGESGRGDGPAGAAVNPRDFFDDPEEWVNGTSPLALFNTLQTGIEGTAMPAYAHLAEETQWALVHYMRTELIPDENLQEVTEDQVEEACRALSAPPRPPAIPIERAMEFLAQDQEHQRFVRRHQLGAPVIDVEADPIRGHEVFARSCASCHGDNGASPARLGPYGAFPPYLYVDMQPLVPASVGGTFQDVARRGLAGPHATLPDMIPLVGLSERDWKDLQAYIANFEGQGRDLVRVGEAPAEEPAEDAEEETEEEAPQEGEQAPAEEAPAQETQEQESPATGEEN